MAGRDRDIDPVTRDYVRDGAGGTTSTTTIAPSMYHMLQGRRNQWWGAPDQGTDLWRVTTMGVTTRAFLFAKNEIETGMAGFIERGRATGLIVEVSKSAQRDDRFCIESWVRDTQGGTIDVSGLAGLKGRD